ncbi:hypothetical protein V8G54_007877 [Vigna mungo]|uniref:Uncharacterized protein n=1 Tax=Vigna mungo TaxID=3915 RepID=A0AAQ3P2Q9_VIGMU
MTTSDVATRQLSSNNQSTIKNPYTMVTFIFFFQTTKYTYCINNTWFRHIHLLKPSFKSCILFYILPILLKRGGTNAPQLTSCKHRLKQICSIHGTLSFSSTKNQMNLINKQNNFPLSLFHLFQNCLQPLLKLSSILRARNQRTHVQCNEPNISKITRNISFNNPLSQPFNHSRFSHTRFTNQNRVIFRPSR